MDQYKREAGAYLTAVILFGCAFIFLSLGLGMIFSYPDKIWQVGVLLLACAAAMIYGGVSNIRLGRKISSDATGQLLVSAKKVVAETKHAESPGAGKQESDHGKQSVRVLARWILPPEESSHFLQQEKLRRKTSTTIEAIVLAVLGSLALVLLKNVAWIPSVMISLLLAGVYWVGKYYLSILSLGRQREMEIVITDRSVIVNGRVNTFSDEQYWLQKVTLDENNSPAYLEFEYGWRSRNGNRFESIRVPVPAKQTETARRLVDEYLIPC